jgi:hypothetical protein
MALQALIGLGLGAYGAYQGRKQEKKAQGMSDRALAQREYEYNQRAPMRRQGMQALGQVEAPMDLGNLGFNSANPFAAARGPAPSTASYGDWGRMTTSPEEIDRALNAQNPQQQAFAAAEEMARTGSHPLMRRAAQDLLNRNSPRQGMQPLGGR